MKHKFIDPEDTRNKLALLQKQLAAESLYHKMVEDVEDYAILLIDPSGVVLNWNKGAEKIKGYRPEEIIGKNFRLFYTREDRLNNLPDRLLRMARKEGHAMQEGWRVRNDGTRFWGSISITSIIEKKNKVIGFTKVTRDLTERKRQEAEIKQAIVAVQEKERHDIAALLHDSVSQMLVASKMFIEQANKKCKNELLEFGVQHVANALKDIRSISHSLDPSAELNLGLSTAIQQLLDNLNRLKKTQFSFSESGTPGALRSELQRTLFRIAQELCNNILKHAQSGFARLKLTWTDKDITLTSSDNGIGFDLKQVKAGLGLQSLHVRAEMFEGTIQIRSAPGKGTKARVSFPTR